MSISSPPEPPRIRRRPPAPGRAPTLLDSFNYAFEGIIHVLRTQRNLRIHFLIAIVVIWFILKLAKVAIKMILFVIAILLIVGALYYLFVR